MKTTLAALVLLGLGAITAVALAQPPEGGPPDGPPPRGDGPGPGGPHGPPPPPPVMEALDTDHDHVISAEEIAKASESLKKCDKNGDGKLTEDETRPPRPPRGPGRRGPGGPDEFGPPPGGPRGEGRDEFRRGDGPGQDGPRRGRRGPGGPDGPDDEVRGPHRRPGGAGGPPPHGFGPPPFPPPHVFEEIGLSDEQKDQLKTLHKETREKFEKILTAEQLEKLKEHGPPGPPRD